MIIPVITSKPTVYALIPDTFDQAIQYVVQLGPVEKGDHVFVGVEIKKLENPVDGSTMLVTQGE